MNSEWNDFRDYYISKIIPLRSYMSEEEPYNVRLQNGLTMTIRAERPDDREAVENLTRRAFWIRERLGQLGGIGCDEHLLCRKLREVPEFIPELDLVAECEIQRARYIAGNVMFTAGYVKPATGGIIPVLIFGPLSVLPEFQRIGVGAALLGRAEEIARKAGWGAIFLYGHPWYYPRLGYVEAAVFSVTTHDGKNIPAFMAKELIPGFLRDAAGGAFHYTPVFDELDPGEVRAFDAAFTPVPANPQARPLSPMHLPYLHRLMNHPETLSAMHEKPTDLAVWENAYINWINKGEQNFIIYSDEKPAGWLKLNGFESDTGWISVLVIDPQYKRRGLGRFAAGFAEQIFRESGLRRAVIHTTEDNIAACACYESCGYRIKERGECTTGDGNRHSGLTYEKEL